MSPARLRLWRVLSPGARAALAQLHADDAEVLARSVEMALLTRALGSLVVGVLIGFSSVVLAILVCGGLR